MTVDRAVRRREDAARAGQRAEPLRLCHFDHATRNAERVLKGDAALEARVVDHDRPGVAAGGDEALGERAAWALSLRVEVRWQ